MDTVPVQCLTVLPGILEECPNALSVVWMAEELRITRHQLSNPNTKFSWAEWISPSTAILPLACLQFSLYNSKHILSKEKKNPNTSYVGCDLCGTAETIVGMERHPSIVDRRGKTLGKQRCARRQMEATGSGDIEN